MRGVATRGRALAERLGLRATGLGDDAWLLQRRAAGRRRLRVRALDDGTWLVRRTGSRAHAVHRLGPPRARTYLVVDDRAAPRHQRTQQMSLLHYVAEQHIAGVLRELRINCVLDVGANAGQYAKRLRKQGYAGRIVSFEPVAHLAAQLQQAADGDPDWLVRRCALGRARHEAEMTVGAGMGRMSSLLRPSDFGRSWGANIEGGGSEAVPVRRLDELFGELISGLEDPRVFLKLDTQGYDLEAFAGAEHCIEQILGMQSEVSSVPIYEGMPRLPEQIATYEAAGFELTGMFPVSMHKPTLRIIEFDAVLVRAAALSTAAGDQPS